MIIKMNQREKQAVIVCEWMSDSCTVKPSFRLLPPSSWPVCPVCKLLQTHTPCNHDLQCQENHFSFLLKVFDKFTDTKENCKFAMCVPVSCNTALLLVKGLEMETASKLMPWYTCLKSNQQYGTGNSSGTEVKGRISTECRSKRKFYKNHA